MEEGTFLAALELTKIPVLVLDQKWHRLFALSGKPEDVKKVEVELNELLQQQGKATTDIKSLKKVKAKLMQSIVDNMDAAEGKASAGSKKLEKDKELIDQTNEKIAELEDKLMEYPKLIKDKNQELMLLTMSFCYHKMRTNTSEVHEIADWIKQVRIDLKKNIIKKQNREINNREIYTYMHDIFGKDVVDIFDIKESEDLALTSKDSANARSSAETEPEEKPEEEKEEPKENIDLAPTDEKEEDHAGNS
ncbi:MAG: hypothetical protein IIT72_09560 [Lachnospiraceae bacterium]|nr:hypothetical protein [Lachnospiraceae bacterium]MBQ5485726.1 hypothetical protein [Lachnospiraceae bacterium]MEE3356144.1 hypothetical protein [Candidatus Weimeria sp.]